MIGVLKLRIVYMGTPEFSVPSLNMLVSEGYDIAAVVTQPDKPKGRGKKLCAPPVKEYALKKGIRVLQPDKIKTGGFASQLREINPDLLITAAYGRILSKEILDIPRLGCINVHASILPKYRGAAPINWAIINGESTTGITTMYTDTGMDTGDILLIDKIAITDDMTAGELHDILAELGAKTLKDTLHHLEAGTLIRVPQDNKEATYAPMMEKTIGEINWAKPSNEIHNLVRGTNPWPGAYTFYNGEKMKVWRTYLLNRSGTDKKPGTIIGVSKEGIDVACADGVLRIKEVQFQSCRRMCVEEYICGHTIGEGEILG
jgi:methionyl-tRNA formyltransferase